MKKILFIALAAMLAGCSQKPDPQVAELEKKVDQLSAQLDANKKYIDAVSDLVNINYALQTNQESVLASKIDLYKTANIPTVIDPATGLPLTNALAEIDPATGLPLPLVETRLSKLESQYSNLVKTVNGKAAVRSPSQAELMAAYQNAIPADVLAQIRAEAQKTFPTDLEMQNFAIKQQADAWLKSHPNQ
jgi:outer membrane murein-binding lipoprotein Lpp